MAQRIVDSLSDAINQGSLPVGTQLPPHRELADQLGVSVGTVSRAYSLARERGLISGTVGKGTFVAPRGDETEDLRGEIDLSMNFIRCDPAESIGRELLAALRAQTDLRSLVETYPQNAGRPEHRVEAAKWLARRGLSVSEDRVVLSNGAQHGMLTVLSALTKPGDVVATEHVTYPGVKAQADHLQLRLAGVPMDAEGLVPEALDRLCAAQPVKVLYTIPTIQNPTGAVMSEDRRETIADIARRRQITILEDDIYAFLLDQPPPPLSVFAPERSYFVTSLSKSLLCGLRLGFVVCPPGCAEKVVSQVRMSLLATSPLTAAIGTRWLNDGTADRIIQWKRTEVRARWELAVSRFGLDRTRQFAAHLWLPLPPAWQPEEFVARTRSRGIVVASADSFAVGPEPVPRAVRICLGVPTSRQRLQEALDVIDEVLRAQPAPVQLV